MRQVQVDRQQRLAWEIAARLAAQAPQLGVLSPASASGVFGSRQVRVAGQDTQAVQAFVQQCARLPGASEPAPIRSRLPDRQRLSFQLQRAAEVYQQSAHPPQPTRRWAWLGLLGGQRPLLDSLVHSGVPLRQELLEQLEALHEALHATPLAREPHDRAVEGARHLDRLRQLAALLDAIGQLLAKGHGATAGFTADILADLEASVQQAHAAVVQLIVQPPESAWRGGAATTWADCVLQP